MMKSLTAAAALILFAGAAAASELKVSFADSAWNGKKVPAGQQCTKFGGKGATPSLKVEGIPPEANAIIVEFNDRSYHPLSYDGGHGKVRFSLKGGETSVVLPAVPGEIDKFPEGIFLEKRNQATGEYARPGYLPPCSGGNGNAYFADVLAVEKVGSNKPKVLAKTRIELGSY